MTNLFTSVFFLGSATPHVFYMHSVLVSPYRSDSCGDISSAQVKLSTSRLLHVKIVTLLKIHLVLCWILKGDPQVSNSQADRTCFCQNVCLTLRLIKVTSDPAPTQLKVFLALHDAAAGRESQMSRRPASSLNLLLQFGRDCCIPSFKENLTIICIS